jgi:hypothetical protein
VTDPTALSRRCWPVPPSLPIISSTGLRGEHALSDRNATIAERHHPSSPTPLIMELAAPSAAFRAANFMINGVGRGKKVEWAGPGCPAAVNGGAATDCAGVQAALALRTQATLAVRTAELAVRTQAKLAVPTRAELTNGTGRSSLCRPGGGWAGPRTRAARWSDASDFIGQLCDRSGGR